MEIEKKLQEMGLSLPTPGTPVGNYVPAVRTGNLLFLSGHVWDSKEAVGKLGKDVTIDRGYQAARNTMLKCLATIKSSIGDLDKVKRVVKLLCMVNSAPDFGDHPKVANGASDLLVELYGEQGRHARSAVGMAALPMSFCVEIEMIVEVAD